MSGYVTLPKEDWVNALDAVRAKTGTSDLIASAELAGKISGISGGGGGSVETCSVLVTIEDVPKNSVPSYFVSYTNNQGVVITETDVEWESESPIPGLNFVNYSCQFRVAKDTLFFIGYEWEWGDYMVSGAKSCTGEIEMTSSCTFIIRGNASIHAPSEE